MSAAIAVATWELRSAVRSRWMLSMGAVFTAAALLVTVFSLRTMRELGTAGASATGTALLNLGILLPPLIGLIVGAGTIAGARERGTLDMVRTQPVRAGAVLAGTFLGVTGAVWLTVAAAFGAAGLAIGAVATGADVPELAAVLAVTLAVSAVAVAIGLALSAVASSHMQAIVAAVAVWFLLALGMDLALVLAVPGLQLGPGAVLAAVLLNPVQAARLLALLYLDPDATSLGPFGSYLLDRFGAGGARVLLSSALGAWTAAGLGTALAGLRRRG